MTINIFNDSRLALYHGEANSFLDLLPDDSVKLVITSPPYNLGKSYERNGSTRQLPINEYLNLQRGVIENACRVLHPQGSICWQVGNSVDKSTGEVFPLDIYYYPLFKESGLFLRNRIIWHFGHGLHAQKRFSGRYETILWFTKSENYTFNLDSVRVPSKYPGKRHYKGPNAGKPSGNPNGKNPSDVWDGLAEEWESCFWEIPNVKSNHPEKTEHPCQFPVELVERCILALTNEDDWVLDPYAGVGSSLIAAIKHRRRAMASEKETLYVNVTYERVQSYLTGDLKLRPMGKPIHQPTGKEKVAQIPHEWQEV